MNSLRGTLHMSAAYVVALLTAAGGYLVYSRILSPGDFAVYAGAMAIAKFGTLLLDGGIKIALIKEGSTLEGGVYRSAFLASIFLAVACTVILGLVLGTSVAIEGMGGRTAEFFWLYSAAYFATYPFLVIPLADLERSMKFSAVAKAEGLTFCIEYALPALLWISIRPGLWSFVLSAWLARTLRAALLLAASRNHTWLGSTYAPDWPRLRRLFAVGFQLQLSNLASTLRDNLHLILVAPLFGRDMAGMYAWVLQLCAVTSQVFVQTASRVSLPLLLATEDAEQRWRKTVEQIVWLTVLTFPALLCLPYIAPAVNHALFQDKWTPALALLPLLICRMLPGLALTPMGAMLLAQQGAGSFVLANVIWSIAELCAAIVFLLLMGPTGLAWSYAIVVWLGVALFAGTLKGATGLADIVRVLLLRPSVWLALALTLPFLLLPLTLKPLFAAILYSAAVCLISMSAEPRVRRLISEAADAKGLTLLRRNRHG